MKSESESDSAARASSEDMEWLVSWKKPSSETEGRVVVREELMSGKETTGGEVVVVVESEERRRSNRGVLLERFGGRRWRRRERRSVAAESEVEVKLGWVVEGVGGGADVLPLALGKSC